MIYEYACNESGVWLIKKSPHTEAGNDGAAAVLKETDEFPAVAMTVCMHACIGLYSSSVNL